MATEAGYLPRLKKEWNRWRVVDMLLPDETHVDLLDDGTERTRLSSRDVEGLLFATYLYPICAASRNCIGRMTMKVFCYPLIKAHRVIIRILSPTLRVVPKGQGWFVLQGM